MNKRFLFQGVKFTLSPGQVLEHSEGGPDDEGYYFRAFTLEYLSADGQTGDVVCHMVSGGRDCDGEHRHYRDLILGNNGLWDETGAEEYDQYAQLAGY